MTNPLKAITNLVKTKSVNSTEKKANSNIDVAQPTKRSGSLAQAKSTGRPFQAKMERMSSSKNIKTLVKNLGAQQKEARKQENLVLTKRAAVQKMGGLLNSLRTDKKYAGNEQKLNKAVENALHQAKLAGKIDSEQQAYLLAEFEANSHTELMLKPQEKKAADELITKIVDFKQNTSANKMGSGQSTIFSALQESNQPLEVVKAALTGLHQAGVINNDEKVMLDGLLQDYQPSTQEISVNQKNQPQSTKNAEQIAEEILTEEEAIKALAEGNEFVSILPKENSGDELQDIMDELIRQGANPLEPLETFDTSENFDIPKDASEVDAWLEASVDNKEIKQAIDVKLTELTQFGKAEAKTMLKNNPDTFLLLKAYTGDEDLGVLELQALEKSLGNMLENHAKQALKEELDGLISDFENWPTNSEPDFNFDPDIIPGGSNQVSTAPENIEDLTTQILDDAERNRTKPS